MVTLEIPLAEELAETAHWSDNPPVKIEEQELDLIAFELWRLGNDPDITEVEELEDGSYCVASRASCL